MRIFEKIVVSTAVKTEVVEVSMIAVTVLVSGAMVVDKAGIAKSSSTLALSKVSVPKSITALVTLVEAAAGRTKTAGLRLAS